MQLFTETHWAALAATMKGIKPEVPVLHRQWDSSLIALATLLCNDNPAFRPDAWLVECGWNQRETMH